MKILENKCCIQIDCPDCKSKLEIVETDIRLDPSTEVLYLQCAACHGYFDIYSTRLPASWRSYIQNLYDND